MQGKLAAIMDDGSVNSSSSFQLQHNYFVFLSFTGQDTRNHFTGNLYDALRQKGIHTFIDDEGLRRGEEISETLVKAIEHSRISIIIFSKNYAFSSWCLDELVKIIECKKTKGQLVWPVFYDVDPSEVRHQRGSFERAMAMHKVKFKGDPEKVQNWRLALKEAANLCGWHFTNGYEFKFIKRITEAVSCVQNRVPFCVAERPVGLESRISDLCSLLGMGSNDKRMIGIHGLGGIGKTTLAKALYNEIADQFEGASFVADVGENSSKRGLVKLQEEFLAEIIGEKKIKLHHVDRGIPIIKDRLCYKRVLLILDDVQKSEHLEKLAGSLDWFGPGSRIIVTTRDKHLLNERGVKIFYEVETLNDDESLELFCWHAFNRKTPLRDYAHITKRAVQYTNGLPLALKIIGSNLCGKKTCQWRCALNNYEKIPPDDIQRILQTSYENLGENEKEIFLDLACFFKGEELEYVEKILKASEFDPVSGIGVLIDKSLIKVKQNKVKVHDLIQDMGRAIVRQSSLLPPGERSRLWHHKDILKILTNDTGTNKIEGIMLDLDKEQEVEWSGDAFKKMDKLRILMVRNALFSKGPTHLPDSLKVLEWKRYPSTALPEDFHPTELVVMSLPGSLLTSLKPFKGFKNLTLMDFTGCEFLNKIPDMSEVPNLTILKLDLCQKLVEIHNSVGYLGKLVTLSARSCIKLQWFPREIRLTSLEHLDLGGFSCPRSIPYALPDQENVMTADLGGTAIKQFPSSLGNLSKLTHLRLDYCTDLWIIPSSFGMLTNLTSISMVSCPRVIPSLISNLDFGKLRYPLVSTLNLRQCSLSDEALPVIVRCFPNVVDLNLSSNDFEAISACINELQYLQRFHVDDCILLQEIEGCPSELALLSAANCHGLTSESINMLGLAHQGSSARNLEVILPATMIPKCCHHYLGQENMSFWVRENFLDVPLCLVSEMEDEEKLEEDCYVIFRISININNLPLLKFSVTRDCNKTPNHVRLIHLRSYIFECSSAELENFKNVEKFFKLEWNHVEISLKAYFFQPTGEFDLGITMPGRVHILGKEDILFRKPPESQPAIEKDRDKKLDSDGGCSFARKKFDNESNNQGSVGGSKLSKTRIGLLSPSPCNDPTALGSLNNWTNDDFREIRSYSGREEEFLFQENSRICWSSENPINCFPDERCSAGGQAVTGEGSVRSSSSFLHQWKYDVYLNFNGEANTHLDFTQHLRKALRKERIHTYGDDQGLSREEDISAPPLKVIEQSRILIIIFSKNYAYSSRCLDELIKIIECMKTKRQLVLPVFYDVDPSDVRHLKGSFGTAMAELEDKFRADIEKVQKWKLALHEAAILSCWHFTIGFGFWLEHKIIQGIIGHVTRVCRRIPLDVANYPVGLESQISYLTLQLGIGSTDVQMIGIYGAGGMGKTTLARALYNSVIDHFEDVCFLADVGEKFARVGLAGLQEELLAEILGKRSVEVGSRISLIISILSRKKVLLILDDVQKLEQLHGLAGSWFGPGSRIIITTRHKKLLIAHEVKFVHEMKKLSYDESLELFCWHVFEQNKPWRVYKDIAKRAVRYAGGLPLALETIGSHLSGKQPDEQRCALDAYEEITKMDIQKMLELSYNDLKEDAKEIFLFLICFFVEPSWQLVTRIFAYARQGIEHLIDKSFIRVENDVIKMHNLIRGMGIEILRQRLRFGRGQRSRLWFHDDIDEDHEGTSKIEGIMLDSNEKVIQWTSLRILLVRNALFSSGLTYLPDSLRNFEWENYPSPALLWDIAPPKLAVVGLLRRPTLSKPFKEKFKFFNFMDFTGCKFLKKIPDMSAVPNLAMLKLDHCRNLVEIHYSVGYLGKLVTLSARFCTKLKHFPSEIRLMSLQKLDLGACYSLQNFPDVPEDMRETSLQRSALQELPSSTGIVFELRLLKLDHCRSLRNMPSSVGLMTNLTEISMALCRQVFQSFKCKLAFGKLRYSLVYKLNLQQCGVSDEDLPVIVNCFPNAKYLDLSKNKFVKVSACINKLYCLEKLYFTDCKLLEEIEAIPPSLVLLSATNCGSLTSQSTNMIALAHQESSNRRFEVKLPGTMIPECFNQCIGEGKISFWVRQDFPEVTLCLAYEFADEEKLEGSFYLACNMWVHVNGLPFLEPQSYWEYRTSHHVRLIHLHSFIDDFKNVHGFEWNHVEILWEVKYHHFPLNMTKPGRVHIYGKESNVMDILPSKPSEFQFIDTLPFTTEKGAVKTVDAEGGCSLPKTSHDDHIHSQQCLKAINQPNGETYGDGGDIMWPYKDKEEDLSSESISNDPLTLGSDDVWINDPLNSSPNEKFSARDQGNETSMTWDPMEMEYGITSPKYHGSTREQGNDEMMGSNKRSQWRFSLCALISSLASLCFSSSP